MIGNLATAFDVAGRLIEKAPVQTDPVAPARLVEEVGPSDFVLDAGCGPGSA